jgi:hypothetical protein
VFERAIRAVSDRMSAEVSRKDSACGNPLWYVHLSGALLNSPPRTEARVSVSKATKTMSGAAVEMLR